MKSPLAAARSGKIIEVNTSGLAKTLQKPVCPAPSFFSALSITAGKKLCLSSDAHTVKDLNVGFEIAADQLRSFGFSAIYYPWDPETPVPLPHHKKRLFAVFFCQIFIYENGLRFLSKLYRIMVYAILGSDGLALTSEDCFFNEQSLHDALIFL